MWTQLETRQNSSKLGRDKTKLSRRRWEQAIMFTNYIIRPIDILVGRLILYPDSSFFFVSYRGACWTELNHIRPHGRNGSKCSLKMHVRNVGYPFPLQIGGPTKPFLTILQLKGNFNGLYFQNGTWYTLHVSNWRFAFPFPSLCLYRTSISSSSGLHSMPWPFPRAQLSTQELADVLQPRNRLFCCGQCNGAQNSKNLLSSLGAIW